MPVTYYQLCHVITCTPTMASCPHKLRVHGKRAYGSEPQRKVEAQLCEVIESGSCKHQPEERPLVCEGGVGYAKKDPAPM